VFAGLRVKKKTRLQFLVITLSLASAFTGLRVEVWGNINIPIIIIIIIIIRIITPISIVVITYCAWAGYAYSNVVFSLVN